MADGKVIDHPNRGRAESPLSEDAIAEQVIQQHGDDIRWCPKHRSWYAWNGTRWHLDESGLVFEMARNVCRVWAINEQSAKWGKYNTIASVEKLCRTNQNVVIDASEVDSDPWILGCPSGIVDLRTGDIREPDKSVFCTKSVKADPEEGEPSLWLQFLDDATAGDKDMQVYLQQVAGYALCGAIDEHALFFVYGPGGNGKSVFINTIIDVMGDYANVAASDMFMASPNTRHPTELADLQGARLVAANEVERGKAWSEVRIKSLTSGDPIKARYMAKDFFTFRPQHTLIIVGNSKPAITNVDDAAKRRFKIIPFLVKPKHPDLGLAEKLRPEYPQILQWMIDGCLDRQAEPRPAPAAVSRETDDYFAEQDTLQQWISQCCDVETNPAFVRDVRTLSSKLYGNWKDWCLKNGEDAKSGKSFSQDLDRAGFMKKPSKFGKEFCGITLRDGRES